MHTFLSSAEMRINMTFEEILDIPPFSLSSEEKAKMLTARLLHLTRHHRDNCPEYARILESISFVPDTITHYKELPFLPVRLFKELSLKSVSDENIVKTMTSSGTSGQAVSKIYLDKATSSNQQKAMVKIVNSFTGSDRMPLILLDCPSVVKNRAMFSARGAGILGFSIFGAKKIYALDDEMKLDVEALTEFLDKFRGQKILLFGFTFMVWQHFYKELVRLKKEGISFDLSNGILIHGGGWKKLANEAVSPEAFHQSLKDVCGITHIHDYYGMVEQTGCIYMQCECGHLHASHFSDVIIRRPQDFQEASIGEKGIIQVVSTIPQSYPGHSLLTEDEGILLGEDDCPCGRKGKYFKVLGRLKNAEIRGCSDTYGAAFQSAAPGSVRQAADNNPKTINDNETVLQDRITYFVGDSSTIRRMNELPPLAMFDDTVIGFLDALSKKLMGMKEAKFYPDVVTLGFRLRKASVLNWKERFEPKDGNIHVGRGVAFHIAPSNVPVNYAYSLLVGLLTGNANIVRIPSKEFPQVSVINHAINEVLTEYETIRPYLCLIRYDKDNEINNILSAMADTRIIWGGDATIANLRKSPIGPRAGEITFADRYSLAVIDSDFYINDENKSKIAQNFYNDTFLSDQNACTSPRIVIWTGTHMEEAKAEFWDRLHELVLAYYSFQGIQSVNKLVSSYLMAAALKGTKIEEMPDRYIVRVKLSEVSSKIMDLKDNSGYFFEYDCKDILELRELCNDTHCQTIGYIGSPESLLPLLQSGIKGVDRVVPVGSTMDFDFIWDGYNLTERLTRTIQII